MMIRYIKGLGIPGSKMAKSRSGLSEFSHAFISIVIPAYNEEKTIEKVIRDALLALKKITTKYEVLVVNDGSSDSTKELLEKISSRNRHVRAISFKENQGVGAALHALYKEAKGEFIFINAADDQVKMKELLVLLPYIADNDIVVGRRMNRADSRFRKLASGLFSLVLRLRFGVPAKDVDSVKVYRASALGKVRPQSRTAFIEAEILIKAAQKKLRIIEVPIKHYSRKHGKAKGLRLKIITLQLKELSKAFFRINWN